MGVLVRFGLVCSGLVCIRAGRMVKGNGEILRAIRRRGNWGLVLWAGQRA